MQISGPVRGVLAELRLELLPSCVAVIDGVCRQQIWSETRARHTLHSAWNHSLYKFTPASQAGTSDTLGHEGVRLCGNRRRSLHGRRKSGGHDRAWCKHFKADAKGVNAAGEKNAARWFDYAGEGERTPLTPKDGSSARFDVESPPLMNGHGHSRPPTGREEARVLSRRRGGPAGPPGRDKEPLLAPGEVSSCEETAPLQTSVSVSPVLGVALCKSSN